MILPHCQCYWVTNTIQSFKLLHCCCVLPGLGHVRSGCQNVHFYITIFLSPHIEAALRGLLGALTSTPYSPTQHLEREQALAKQFAEILHFTLRFDELKVHSEY